MTQNPWALTDEQIDLQRRAQELAEQVIAPRAAEVDETEQYPWDNVEELKDCLLYTSDAADE